MKISIIVPAFNEEKLLPATLKAIQSAAAAFRTRNWDTELIVCDNNSTDRTAELARQHGATVVFEKINQIGRARNRGAQAATGHWMIFIDADSHPSKELFGDVAAAITDGRWLGGGCTVKLDRFSPLLATMVGLWNWISIVNRWVAGSFIFCEAETFRELGGFDLRLFATEELELSRRLKKLARSRGKRLVILRKHPLTTSSRKVHLYTAREHLAFLLRTALMFGRTLKSAEGCPTWYDGRR